MPTLPFKFLVLEVFSHTDSINLEPQIGSEQSTLILDAHCQTQDHFSPFADEMRSVFYVLGENHVTNQIPQKES